MVGEGAAVDGGAEFLQYGCVGVRAGEAEDGVPVGDEVGDGGFAVEAGGAGYEDVHFGGGGLGVLWL